MLLLIGFGNDRNSLDQKRHVGSDEFRLSCLMTMARVFETMPMKIYIFISSNLRSVGEFGVCLYVWQKYSHCPSLTEVMALLFAQYFCTAETVVN